HVEHSVRDDEHFADFQALATPRLDHGVEAPTFEQLHDEEDGSVVVYVVIENGNRSGVIDPVGDIAFAQEATADARIHRELGMEHLDRATLAVPVGRFEDGSHAADAEDALNAPLSTKDGANARLSAALQVGLEVVHSCRMILGDDGCPETKRSW